MTTTDTPLDACPHCGAGIGLQYTGKINPVEIRIATCGTWLLPVSERTEICREREKSQKLEAEVERLRSTMRSFIDFMDENLGATADWPMEATFDDEKTCQRHCDHLNAMKRIVKPEDIN